MTNSYLVVGAASAVALATGAISGYFVAKQVLEPKYVQLAEKEIEDAKEYYSRLYKKDAFSNPVDLVNLETAEALVEQLEYQAEKAVTTPEELEMDMFLQSIEKAKEHGDPYVISREVYMSNDSEHTQLTLTYFEADDVLVDSDDTVLHEYDEVIGIGQLSRFGMLSGDNNVVYVRNIQLGVDFEVVRNKGSYAKDVLGFIEHADHNKVRKFRRDYE